MQIVDALGEDGLLRYYGSFELSDLDSPSSDLLDTDGMQVSRTGQHWARLSPLCFQTASEDFFSTGSTTLPSIGTARKLTLSRDLPHAGLTMVTDLSLFL
jgi:hypothetical protein